MRSFSKYACAFVLAGGLATPAFAAQGDAGSGPTTGATSTNDAGSGPTQGATSTNDVGSGPTNGAADKPESPMQHGQSELNANPAAVNPGSPVQKGETETSANPAATNGANMHIAQKLRADLDKAGFTNITIMPSSLLVRAKNSEGNPVMMVISPDSVTALTDEGTQPSNSASNSKHMGEAATALE